MKRPVGVIVSACLQILGSLVALLLSASMVILPLVAPNLRANQPELPPHAVIYGMGVFYLVFVVLGLATAVGLFRLKQWARVSTLVFAGALLFFGLLFAVVFWFLPYMVPPSNELSDPATAMRQVRLFLIVPSVLLAALGGWWLYYFNRAKVSERFLRQSATVGMGNSEAPRVQTRIPMSIVIIACLSLFGALSTFAFGLSWRLPAMFFLLLITGNSARVFYVAFGLLHAYVGVGLLKLWASARYLAIALYVYGSLNCLLYLLLPQRYLREITNSSQTKLWAAQQTTATTMNPLLQSRMFMVIMVFSLISSLVMLYFVISRRAAFERVPAIPAHA